MHQTLFEMRCRNWNLFDVAGNYTWPSCVLLYLLETNSMWSTLAYAIFKIVKSLVIFLLLLESPRLVELLFHDWCWIFEPTGGRHWILNDFWHWIIVENWKLSYFWNLGLDIFLWSIVMGKGYVLVILQLFVTFFFSVTRNIILNEFCMFFCRGPIFYCSDVDGKLCGHHHILMRLGKRFVLSYSIGGLNS